MFYEDMECPNKHGELEKVLFHNVEVDYCPVCLGIWFDKDELLLAKNDRDKQLNWLDFDIWKEKEKFKISQSKMRCPVCRIAFIRVNYDDAKIKIDFCKHCQGIWLDRGEFKQIIVYLKKKADYEVLHHYAKNLSTQLWEVFTGPKKFREELADVMMLLKLFNYKFMVQHPFLNYLIENSQK